MDGLSAPLGRKAPLELVQAGQAEITHLREAVDGLRAVLLSSTDGFELAASYHLEALDGGKLAAVSSSILALVTSFIAEIQLKGCQSITLEAENGRALIVSVPAGRHPMLMVIIARPGVLLGSLFHHIKVTVNKLVELDQRYG